MRRAGGIHVKLHVAKGIPFPCIDNRGRAEGIPQLRASSAVM